MDPETTTAFTRVHNRVDKSDDKWSDAFLTLTIKLTELAVIVEALSAAKAAEKPSMSFWQQRFVIAGFQMGVFVILGVAAHFYTQH